jgi:nicotinamidase-related amidase
MNSVDTALLVVDAQEKLLAVVPDRPRIVWNIRRLIDAAAVLSMPVAATEQCPEKLGRTVSPLVERLPAPIGKTEFSAANCFASAGQWAAEGVQRVLVCGIETHVCVAQTALDLTAMGFMLYVAVDAVGTRHAIDHETALRRMEAAGVVLTTTEAAMFEWCREAGTPQFKAISALAKEPPPQEAVPTPTSTQFTDQRCPNPLSE